LITLVAVSMILHRQDWNHNERIIMRLVTYEIQTVLGPFQRVGIWQDDNTIVDANFAVAEYLRQTGDYEDVYREADHVAPTNMIDFITGGERTLHTVREALTYVHPPRQHGARGEQFAFSYNEVRLCAPLPRPRRIHDFMVVEEHVRNGLKSIPAEWYNMPVCYKGNPDAVIGPGDPVYWPRYTKKLDYELELCVILSTVGGRTIAQ
jgi:2-keto-4-pentenoate hydratase/2-oxohepta-3-ene-1,7-dioic acid hydratase in catechol pathway